MSDLISRQDMIATVYDQSDDDGLWAITAKEMEQIINEIPSAEPEIIYCKDCKRHNVDIGDCREENDKRHWYWKDEACPLVRYRGKAEGHEYDYQFCVYAERRTDE